MGRKGAAGALIAGVLLAGGAYVAGSGSSAPPRTTVPAPLEACVATRLDSVLGSREAPGHEAFSVNLPCRFTDPHETLDSFCRTLARQDGLRVHFLDEQGLAGGQVKTAWSC